MNFRAPVRAFLAILLIFLISNAAIAEQYQGTVKFGGVLVPGVVVTASQDDKKYTAVTDDQGIYTFPDLGNGVWSIEVEMSGFSKIKEDVTMGPDVRPGAWELKMLSMDEMAATPTVTAPVSSSSATPTATPAPTPTAGNNRPAANANSQQSGFQRANLNASSGAAAAASDAPAFVNESAGDLTQRAADGLLINGSVNNGAASPFAQLAAFGNNRRTRSLYSGAFSLATNNSIFNARSFSLTGQDTAKPEYNYLVGGFSFQGPLRIPRLVKNGPNFFMAYQRTDNRAAQIQPGLMPTVAQRNGDLSTFSGQIIDPATGLPFSGNLIPANRISPQARALLSYFPEPNFVTGTTYNYQIPVLTTTHQDSFQSRLAKIFSPKNQVSGALGFQRTATDNPNVFSFLDTTQILGIVGSANWTHRSGQRFSTTVGYQFSRLRTRQTPQFANRLNVSGLAGISGNNQQPLYWGPPALNFSGGTTTLSDGFPAFNRNETNAFSYSNLWIHSPHSFTWGGDFRRQQFNVLSQQDPRGTFTFTGALTGSDFADFLLGVPSTTSIAFGNADKYFRQNVYDLYLNDDWRVRTGLTLTLGLRWDYEEPAKELYGRVVNLNITPGFTAATPVIGQVLNPDRNGVQPRAAFAWRPLAASSLVVRGGYGVYRNTSVYQSIVSQMAQQAPLSKSLSVQNSPATPLTLATGFNVTPPPTPNTFAVDPNFRIGYAQTWNLSVQRDLPASMQMVATYTGSKGTRLMQEVLPNTYPLGVTSPCPTCPTGFAYLSSNGNSMRESGQIQLRRRLRNGLTASFQYTLSKAIDDAGFSLAPPVQPAGTSGPAAAASTSTLIAQNWLDLRAERALSTFDQRHQVIASMQYTTGMGAGLGSQLGGWRGALYKEWTATTQITVGSGMPLTPIYLSAVKGTGITGNIRPNYTGAPIYTSEGGVFLNRAAYVAPSGEWGNAGRDSIIGPSQFAMIGSFARTIRVNDRVNADLRFDASNLLNHVTFASWNNYMTSAQFGAPVSPNAMRTIQTTLRIRF